MGCINKTPLNPFNFVFARSVTGLTIADLGTPIDFCADYVEPPMTLVATTTENGKITLTWDASQVIGELNFQLQRSVTSPSSGFSLLATIDPNIETYEDSTTDTYTNIYYRIRAIGAEGNSAWSNVATGQSILSDPTVLVISDPQLDSLQLDWTDNSSGENGFSIERSNTEVGGYSEIDTVSTNVTTYVDSTVLHTQTYYYRVRAIGDNSGYSGYTNTDSGTTLTLNAPSDIILTPALESVQADWTSNSGGDEDSFTLQFSLDGSTGWTTVETVGSGVVTSTHSSLNSNTDYYYRVKATKDSKDTPYSAVVMTTTLEMAAPSDLAITNPFYYRNVLTWTLNNGGNEDFVQLYRKLTIGSDWMLLSALPTGTTGYTDDDVKGDTQYDYRVRVYRTLGVSPYDTETITTSTANFALLDSNDDALLDSNDDALLNKDT